MRILFISSLLLLSACSGEAPAPTMTPAEKNEWMLLSAQMQEYEKSKQSLKHLVIKDTSIRTTDGKPDIRFSVKNNSPTTVHQLQIRIEIWNGQPSPLLMEYINLPIEEGIIPNGTYTWNLTPSGNAQWRQLPDLDQVDMTLAVEQVMDKNGRPIYSIFHVNKADRLRYLKLKALAE